MNQIVLLGLVAIVFLMMNTKKSKVSSKSKKSECNMMILAFVGFLVFVMMNKKNVVEGFNCGEESETTCEQGGSAEFCQWVDEDNVCTDINSCDNSATLQCFMSGIENIQDKCGGTWDELDSLKCSPPSDTKDDCLKRLRDFKGIYAGMFNETEHLADIITSCTSGDSATPSNNDSSGDDSGGDDSGGNKPSNESVSKQNKANDNVKKEGFRNRRKRL